MKQYFCILALAFAALVPMPALAAPSGGCATLGVSTSPDTVTAGYGVGIYGSISNCTTSGRSRYTVVVSAMSDCGQKTTIASFRMAFKPGENRMYGVSYATSPDTCAGPSNITVEVHDGSGMVASASKVFTIVN